MGKGYTPRLTMKEDKPVTVCVAAMFTVEGRGIGIAGASDRMLTVPPDIQYEPRNLSKIVHLTNSIVIMTAGDAALQAELLQSVTREAYYRIDTANPKRWLGVKEVAEIYSEYYTAERLRRAEQDVLGPLGLDFTNYAQSPLVVDVAKELYRYQTPSVAAIIAGVDTSGAHIYVVRNSDVSCHDKVGFAAIGVGQNHAGSHFMFAGHSKYRGFPETLLSTYFAKKRAEAAPGVGKETDMFLISPRLGSVTEVKPAMLHLLDTIYRSVQEEQRKIVERSEAQINEFFNQLFAGAAEPQEKGGAEGGEATSEGGGEGASTLPAADAGDVRDEPTPSEPKAGQGATPDES